MSKVASIDPDGDSDDGGCMTREEDREEVFQFAARALRYEFGPGIRLKKAPRVLMLEGDLDGVIGDWRDVLLGSISKGRDEVGLD